MTPTGAPADPITTKEMDLDKDSILSDALQLED